MGNVPIQMLWIPEQITACQQATRHKGNNVAARNPVSIFKTIPFFKLEECPYINLDASVPFILLFS
jgi:hypothetical protein